MYMEKCINNLNFYLIFVYVNCIMLVSNSFFKNMRGVFMQNLKINNLNSVQENFMGNGAVYHGYAGMSDDAGRVYTDDQCRIEAKRAGEMKLKIARTFYTWWAWDEKTNTWDWENHNMKAFYRWLERMKAADITVAINAGWCSPGDINGSSWTGKSPFGSVGNFKKSVENYADWVSESVHQLVELRGFTNVKILTLFTEPQFGNSGVLEDGLDAYNSWGACVKAAHAALVRDNRRHLVKLMGPNEGSTDTSAMVKWLSENEEIRDIIDIYSSHNYQNVGNVCKKYIKSGNTSMLMSLAGGRMSRQIKLKPNTEYIAYTDILFDDADLSKTNGQIYFGVFDNNSRVEGDIHSSVGSGPTGEIAKGSTLKIIPDMLDSKFKRYTVSFNSGDNEKAVVGVFHDIKTAGISVIDKIFVGEKGSDENVVPNGDMENIYDGWYHPFAGGTPDAYNLWYQWAKTGLQYVPKDKEYCFDEYNSTYSRGNDRINHGVEIVTAAVALMNAGVNSSLLWTAFDQQWPCNHTNNGDSFYDGDHRCGVMPVLTRTLVPHKSYYAFSLLSKYVDGNGSKVFEGFGNDCLHLTMSVSNEGYITVVVVNSKDVADEFEIKFEKSLNTTLYRHTFDPETLVPDEYSFGIGIDKTFENVADTLTDTISAYGVKVYTTHLD